MARPWKNDQEAQVIVKIAVSLVTIDEISLLYGEAKSSFNINDDARLSGRCRYRHRISIS